MIFRAHQEFQEIETSWSCPAGRQTFLRKNTRAANILGKSWTMGRAFRWRRRTRSTPASPPAPPEASHPKFQSTWFGRQTKWCWAPVTSILSTTRMITWKLPAPPTEEVRSRRKCAYMKVRPFSVSFLVVLWWTLMCVAHVKISDWKRVFCWGQNLLYWFLHFPKRSVRYLCVNSHHYIYFRLILVIFNIYLQVILYPTCLRIKAILLKNICKTRLYELADTDLLVVTP